MAWDNTDDYTRPAHIRKVFIGPEDHGIQTVGIDLEWPGGGQGFGFLGMQDREEAIAFVRSIAIVFGCVNAAEDEMGQALIGEKCHALYAFSGGGRMIEGLQSVSTGRTFTLQAWRKSRGYLAPSPLESALTDREQEIAHLQRRLRQAIERRPQDHYRELPEGEAP
jgi:hypothetical protein